MKSKMMHVLTVSSALLGVVAGCSVQPDDDGTKSEDRLAPGANDEGAQTNARSIRFIPESRAGSTSAVLACRPCWQWDHAARLDCAQYDAVPCTLCQSDGCEIGMAFGFDYECCK